MADWQPKPGHILTRWAGTVSPERAWTAYPRPQMTRTAWMNLNGLWNYGIAPKRHRSATVEGQILVPFPIESALSGVKRSLKPNQRLWVHRTFIIPEDWTGQRVLLHFGAVDWEAAIWVNDQKVGTHRGGYLPFDFDITPLLRAGNNHLVVAVWDPTDRSWGARGKQVRSPRGIWYTAVSGIWQTVWLEPVPQTYIRKLKITPDIDTETLEVTVSLDGTPAGHHIIITAFDGRTQVGVAPGKSDEPLQMSILNPILWSPDSPHLYNLQVEVYHQGTRVDQVNSYFGMRKFSLAPDETGRMRLCLNHKPTFLYGPLDQGYWPDGLYTPPSEEAMRSDVEFLKQIGCNMLRKHVKVEPPRFYYDCDRMGIIVWQDMVNGGKPVGSLISTLATIFSRLTRKDDRMYWGAGRARKESRDDYRCELNGLVDHLHNFACIGMWVPFNEGWGQFDASQVAEWLKTYDPTRPVDHASGWFDQGGGDFRSIHTYFIRLKPELPEGNRAVILSEFGGYALKIAGHIWNPNSQFGYRKFGSDEALTEAYIDLLENQLKPWIAQGLSAAVYTQTTDVEIEINGYLTYDRAVVKMDPARIAEVHASLYQAQGAPARAK